MGHSARPLKLNHSNNLKATHTIKNGQKINHHLIGKAKTYLKCLAVVHQYQRVKCFPRSMGFSRSKHAKLDQILMNKIKILKIEETFC